MKPDKINKLIKRLAAVSLWLIIWQIASVMTGLELLLASPVTVLRTLAGMLVTRQFYGILYLSVMHIMSGMLAAAPEHLCAPTPSIHRLRRGLPGYLILFAPHAFEPQCQLQSSEPPSPLVFLLISTHFTATLGIPLTPPAL